MRLSSIDKAPQEVQDEIGRLRREGATIDQIVAHLRRLNIGLSRSALGRHIKDLDAVGQDLREMRSISDYLVSPFGEESENRTSGLNYELVQIELFKLISRAREDGLDAASAAALSKTLLNMAQAKKTDADYIVKVEKRAAERANKEAASAAEAVGRERGLSAEVIGQIKSRIFGLTA